MGTESRSGSGRASRSWWAGLVVAGAVAGLGADRPEVWRAAALPPVTLAPDASLPPAGPEAGKIVPVSKLEVPTSEAAPPLPIPAVMPARPDPRPAAPASPATTAPAAPSLPAPAPVLDSPAMVGAPAARVYVLNGVSLFGPSGFSAMVDRIRDGGYPDTRSGAWFQAYQFERDIRRLHREQPGTPVVVIGYSFGVYRAKAIANRLTRDGIPVAMVGYVGGDYLQNSATSSPGGARVVNVTGNGFLLSGRNLLFRGTDLTGADNTRLDVRHLNLPRQTETVDALLNGMAAATTGVPSAVAVSPPTGTVVSSSPAGIAGTPNALAQPRPESTRLLPTFTGTIFRR